MFIHRQHSVKTTEQMCGRMAEQVIEIANKYKSIQDESNVNTPMNKSWDGNERLQERLLTTAIFLSA
jgi:hypothetical protein